MRFGKNAVKTPGRTHDNDCVTKGLKVSLKPFQRLGVAHVRRTRRGKAPSGLQVQGGALVAHRNGRNFLKRAKQKRPRKKQRS